MRGGSSELLRLAHGTVRLPSSGRALRTRSARGGEILNAEGRARASWKGETHPILSEKASVGRLRADAQVLARVGPNALSYCASARDAARALATASICCSGSMSSTAGLVSVCMACANCCMKAYCMSVRTSGTGGIMKDGSKAEAAAAATAGIEPMVMPTALAFQKAESSWSPMGTLAHSLSSCRPCASAFATGVWSLAPSVSAPDADAVGTRSVLTSGTRERLAGRCNVSSSSGVRTAPVAITWASSRASVRGVRSSMCSAGAGSSGAAGSVATDDSRWTAGRVAMALGEASSAGRHSAALTAVRGARAGSTSTGS
mmetsp:Transcript_14288/g.38512  ORF Transcript_14288/g.38512 Transcript_14288/m.38512 type:complete len:317 (-) Transcript_14288:132-1082(-)